MEHDLIAALRDLALRKINMKLEISAIATRILVLVLASLSVRAVNAQVVFPAHKQVLDDVLSVQKFSVQEPRPQSNPNFVVDVHLNRTQIYSYEPLTAVAEMQNISDQKQLFTSSWDSDIQVSEDQIRWKNASQGLSESEPPRPYNRDFAPGQKLTRLFTLNLDRDRKSLFPSPGTYWIRAWFAGLYSEPKAVEVLPVAKEDEAAWQYLRDNPLYQYFVLKDALDTARSEESLRFLVTKNRAKPEEVPAATAEVRLAEFIRLFPHFSLRILGQAGISFLLAFCGRARDIRSQPNSFVVKSK